MIIWSSWWSTELSQIIFHWEPNDFCHCVATYSILYFQLNSIFFGSAVGMYRILSCRSTFLAKVPSPRSRWSGTLVYEVYCQRCCWWGDHEESGWSGTLIMNFIVSGVVEEGIIKKAALGVFMFVTTWGISLLWSATGTASAVADNNIMLITAKNSFRFVSI